MGYAFQMLDKMMIILTSVDQPEQAQWIAQQLLEKRLAACVQQTTGRSMYRWQGELECSQEYYLHIKTSSELKEHVIGWLEQYHPYDVPEIISLEALCSRDYGQWLHSSVLEAECDISDVNQ